MKVYLDNCCFNRPYDDKSNLNNRLEAEAKLFIQELIKKNEINLIWSFILEYENEQNPFEERKKVILEWKKLSKDNVSEDEEVITYISKLEKRGVKGKDAVHIACALKAGCDYFITTDYILKKTVASKISINVVNPIDFIREWEENE